jgi:hypothetical protein
MKKYYLFAAIMGIIIPVAFFVSFIQQSGLDLPAFVSALFVNGAAGGFSADLLILSFVSWVSMFQHKKRRPSPCFIHRSQSLYRAFMRASSLPL